MKFFLNPVTTKIVLEDFEDTYEDLDSSDQYRNDYEPYKLSSRGSSKADDNSYVYHATFEEFEINNKYYEIQADIYYTKKRQSEQHMPHRSESFNEIDWTDTIITRFTSFDDEGNDRIIRLKPEDQHRVVRLIRNKYDEMWLVDKIS